jgi:16S rRNA (adenine1518-N6/adenine1519-N6)-dimethyltransferase
LDNGVDKLICVEADTRFAAALQTWPEAQTGQLKVTQQDARKTNWVELLNEVNAKRPVMIVANLPYNVGTPLLINWLKAGDWRGSMALMFQKEVAERVCARPGEKHYGRLAVITAAVCDAHIAFTLPPGAFNPPPKVDSAVAVLHPLSTKARFAHINAIETVAAAAFGQRRKMLRAALKSLAKTVDLVPTEWLESCNIDPTARAETLTQTEFRALASKYQQANAQ